MSIYQGNKKVLGGITNIEENKVKEIIDSERPITTTINSSSTDTQIPSAKSVYNATSQFLKTYTSFEQLGLTGGSETIEDIANNMGDCTRLIAIIGENISNVSIYPYINGTLIVEKLNIYRVHFKFCIDGSPLVYVGNYHTISGFTGWSRLCSTKLGDVPWTPLTMGSGMNGSMQYRVKNGICYVHVDALKSSTMNTSGQTITSGLPAPEIISHVWYSLTSNSPTNGSLLVNISGTGKMTNNIGVNDAVYYGYFSYPVAES